MVTLPSAASNDAKFLVRLATLGVEAVRIIARMIAHVAHAVTETGRRMKIMMDLPGLKIRTGAVHARKDGTV